MSTGLPPAAEYIADQREEIETLRREIERLKKENAQLRRAKPFWLQAEIQKDRELQKRREY